MKLIEPSVLDITPENFSLEDNKKFIEYCGRICYNSFDKITDTSYETFVNGLIKRGHTSPLEHATVYLVIKNSDNFTPMHFLLNNKYTFWDVNTLSLEDKTYYITTNMRVLQDFGWVEKCEKYRVDKPIFPYHIPRITLRVKTSIGISREFNRHRTLSITEKSTRYTNIKGNMEFIKPYWYKDTQHEESRILEEYLKDSENTYSILVNTLERQQAREILPLCTATEVIYTATKMDWISFLLLRSSEVGAKGQHPDANIVANLIYKETKKYEEIYRQKGNSNMEK